MLGKSVEVWLDKVNGILKKSTNDQQDNVLKMEEVKSRGGSKNLWLQLIHLREQRNHLRVLEHKNIKISLQQNRYQFMIFRLKQLIEILNSLEVLSDSNHNSILLTEKQYTTYAQAEQERRVVVEYLYDINDWILKDDFVLNEDIILEIDRYTRYLYRIAEIFYEQLKPELGIIDYTGDFKKVWMFAIAQDLTYEEYMGLIPENIIKLIPENVKELNQKM